MMEDGGAKAAVFVGLGDTEDIPAFEEGRDGHRLDRRRRTVPRRPQHSRRSSRGDRPSPSVRQRLSTSRLNPEVRSSSVPDVPALMQGAEDVDSKVHLKLAILYASKMHHGR